MVGELVIQIAEENVVMDEGVTRDNAEEVDKTLSGSPNEAGEKITTACGRVKNGQVNIRIGVHGMKEATAGDRIRGTPEFEDAVDIDEVAKEAAVLVPALACTNRTEDGDEAREDWINNLQLRSEERKGSIQKGREVNLGLGQRGWRRGVGCWHLK